MGIFLGSTPAEARLAPYDGIGGNGGAPFRLDCGEYGVLVGLTGRSGAVVDQVTGLCVKIDPVSGIWVGGVYETNPAGGPGGDRFHKICPVGQALTGIQGNSTRFQGNEVVSSLGIDCTKIKITDNVQFPEIKGWREIGLQGDEDALKSPEFQDLCYIPAKATGHFERAWSLIGIALEGRAGIFVDHIHIICWSLPQDKKGYRVQFTASAKGPVPEGTPFQITWRASGSKPELTSNLQYRWELHDVTPAPPGGSLTRRTDVRSPYSYAQPPCATSWFDSSSGSKVIFQSLPPAKYELRLKVRPTVPSTVESKAQIYFEIRDNQLVEVVLDPPIIRSGGISTATIRLEGPAPPGGKKVFLTSSNAQLIPVPEALTIPGGATSTSLKLRAAGNLQIGQAIIRASTRKPLKVAVSKFSHMNVLGRGIPETDEPSVTGSQESTEAGTPQGAGGSPDSLSSEGTPKEEIPESEVSVPTENITQEQEITERGISSFRLGGSSKLDSKILSTKPNQGALGTFPDVTKVPSTPPGVPILYPNVSGSNVVQSNSKIQEATKLDKSLLTKPGPSDTAPQALSKVGEVVKSQKSLITKPREAKEAVITVQSSLFERKPLAVPNVPPLQK
jgi:hypothetical protein